MAAMEILFLFWAFPFTTAIRKVWNSRFAHFSVCTNEAKRNEWKLKRQRGGKKNINRRGKSCNAGKSSREPLTGSDYWFNDYARSNQNSAFPTSIYYEEIQFQSFSFLFQAFPFQFSASFIPLCKFSAHYNLFIHYTHHNSQFHLPERHQLFCVMFYK